MDNESLSVRANAFEMHASAQYYVKTLRNRPLPEKRVARIGVQALPCALRKTVEGIGQHMIEIISC